MNERNKMFGIVILSLLTMNSVSNYAWSESTEINVKSVPVQNNQNNDGTTQEIDLLDKKERNKFLSVLDAHGYSQSNSPELYSEIEKKISAQKSRADSKGDWRAPVASSSAYPPVFAFFQLDRESLIGPKILSDTIADGVMSFTSVNGTHAISAAVYSGIDSVVPDADQTVARTIIVGSFYDVSGSRIGTTGLYDSFENKQVRIRMAVDANYLINTVAEHESISIKASRMIFYKAPGVEPRIERLTTVMPAAYVLDVARNAGAEIAVEINDPKRIRPVMNGLKHVRVCVNRADVAGPTGCDIKPVPGKQEITFTVDGKLTLNGKYFLEDPKKPTMSIPGATDIAIWLKQNGLDKTGSLEARPGEPAVRFADFITRSYSEKIDPVTKKVKRTTVFAFTIPRKNVYFGKASDYERSGATPNEDDDKKLNWTISMQMKKDVIGTAICDVLRTTDPTHTCLLPHNLTLSAKDSTNANLVGLPQLAFVYGCLAKGTLVMTESGELIEIEDMNVGDVVKSGDMNMMVSSISSGWENEPMYRLETEAKHSMLLTRTHPVFTKNRGIVWASEIVVGDKVVAEEGTTNVVRLSQESYDDNVYNLQLEPLRENEDLVKSHHQAFYANGLLVGDSVMQNRLQSKNSKKIVLTKAQALKAISTRWHKDYQHLLKKNNK